jgi:hypothetical protein
LATLLLPLFLLRPAFGQDAKLIEAFDRVVYGTGLPWARERALRIEEQEVRLDLYGAVTPERLALLQALAADLSLLTGLAIVVSPMEIAPAPLGNPAPGLAQFQLHLLPPQAFPALLDQSWIPQSTRASHARSLCSFVTRGRETIRGALILIDATLAEAAIRHCLVEETAQAFGAIDDTTLLDPSAFNDWGTLVDRLQPDDRRILRALYDPRLRPGMTRTEVLPLLPELLKD